jgi:cytochrome c oxidase subunit 2
MNWQLPTLIGQASDDSIRARVEATTLPDTTVPDSALERVGTSNPFATEYWFPEQASSFASDIDSLYMGIFWISLVFFIGIVGSMLYFIVKYQRKGDVIAPEPSPSHNTAIEILWSVLPSILLVWMFYEGATGYFDMRTPKEDAEEIHVMASRYNWLFTYPDGDSSSELHLVMDRPTKLILQSKDVLHSFFVPAFRQKMDIVPGRYTYAYIMPTKPGQYRLSCTEYCGQGHSKMRTMAEVHTSDEDRKANTVWIRADHKPWENGQRTYNIQCSGCHKINGEAATGPALNLLMGKSEEKLHGGGTVPVNDQYIQDSIWYPEKHVVEGYGPVSKMNSFKGQLSEEDVNDVIAFLKYLNDPNSVGSEPAGETPASESPDTESEN